MGAALIRRNSYLWRKPESAAGAAIWNDWRSPAIRSDGFTANSQPISTNPTGTPSNQERNNFMPRPYGDARQHIVGGNRNAL